MSKIITDPEQLRLTVDPPKPDITVTDKLPARTDVLVIPADDPNQPKIGWKMYEVVPGSPEWEEHQKEYQPARLAATDEADKYKVYHHREMEKLGRLGWTSIPVLEFLNGRPWDNAALNVIRALRPSSVRVTTGQVTLDASVWRVTVTVEADERTIKSITQEVEVGLDGCRNGWDVSMYVQGVTPPEKQPYMFINPRGLKKLRITDE